jgi:protein-S-isoprenylcysteine O-methyltransferase Ste14
MVWLRSALFTLVLPGSVLIWVPWWLLASADETLDLGAVRWLGVALVAVGASGLLWCIWEFAHTGRGTLAPVDPPRFMVRSGLYRYVRNPMYVSVLTTLVGEVLLFGSLRVLVWTAVVAMAVHLFVIGYEEPALRAEFGDDYEAYCRAVPRWLPRRPR